MAHHKIMVTVLMPCKDPNDAFFKKALGSVIGQNTPAWNLIVVDDHSEEIVTKNYLKELSKSKDKRVSVIKNESNRITGALNTGMKFAQTPYVCSLHCDDLLDRTAVGVLSDYMNRYPDVDYFHSSRIHIDENGSPVGPVLRARESFDLYDFKNFCPVKHLHCWKVKSALDIGGMDESLGLHGADDYDFPWCMAEAGFSFQAIRECLYYYRDHRAHYRLTTHVPLNYQIYELKKIFIKHDLDEKEIMDQIERRKKGYLRQALFTDDEDKRIKQKDLQRVMRKGWREKIDKDGNEKTR